MKMVVTTGAARCAKFQTNRRHQQTNIKLFTGTCQICKKNSYEIKVYLTTFFSSWKSDISEPQTYTTPSNVVRPNLRDMIVVSMWSHCVSLWSYPIQAYGPPGIQHADDDDHKIDCRLPLLLQRSTAGIVAAKHHYPLATTTKVYCLMTDTSQSI